jgi:hypothetical protein
LKKYYPKLNFLLQADIAAIGESSQAKIAAAAVDFRD